MSIFDYENPAIANKYRKGTSGDPFINISEPLQVVNGKVLLSEIPDEFVRVQVSDGSTPLVEKQNGDVSGDEYKVNYSLGVVYFHSDQDGETFTFDYKGRGVQFFNANRIFTKYDSSIGEVQETLQQLIEESQQNRDNAQQMADYAETQGDYAKTQGDYASSQGDYAQEKGDYAQSVSDDIAVEWKNPVDSYDDISDVYPSPSIGWTVMTLDTHEIYRYDDSNWVLTQKYNDTPIPQIQDEVQNLQEDKVNKNGDTMDGGLKFGNITLQWNNEIQSLDFVRD